MLLAKLITELLFFAISWTVQRYVIFFKENEESDAGAEPGAVSEEVLP